MDRNKGHVVGVDGGGTATRALAVGPDGNVLGRGRSGGANPNSHSPEDATAHLAEAITRSLDGLDAARTRACVVGMAGASKLNDQAVAEAFERTWEGLGLGCPVRVVSDAEAAFASATTAPDGTVLIAGTGSIAARIRKRRRVSVAGGYGWLLGDEGSAFWLGRQAVRATLDALTGGRSLDGLPEAVLTEAFGAPPAGAPLEVAHKLITVANAEAPIRLARFAPLVSAAEQHGDPVAGEITTRAAELLVAQALAAREPGEDTPVVLVGSVLSQCGPVAKGVRAGLRGLEVLASADGELGAAWLAAVDAYGENAPRPQLR
ncbi:N-acetylglucosamine kinase [Amycolatopsis palatopharyngis]|uniref:N-acetylglucosamine kinase n=1 Tax=Amycolatopsis palatopharyngis TaxID=187982 RepID=UPI000E26DC6C|nr:BadF/BadG/BcrA/BcrD ATPase family protein [Amycolatopsis palatopharyngis]